jgi:hypothetical protein
MPLCHYGQSAPAVPRLGWSQAAMTRIPADQLAGDRDGDIYTTRHGRLRFPSAPCAVVRPKSLRLPSWLQPPFFLLRILEV